MKLVIEIDVEHPLIQGSPAAVASILRALAADTEKMNQGIDLRHPPKEVVAELLLTEYADGSNIERGAFLAMTLYNVTMARPVAGEQPGYFTVVETESMPKLPQ